MMMSIGMLGPLDVRRGAAAIRMATGKPRIVLAYLIAHAGRTVSIDDLVAELWAGSPPRSAVANIRTYVAGLRRSLGAQAAATIEVRPNGYLLRLADDCRLDLDEFRALVGRGRAEASGGAPHTAVRYLDQALGIWRGSALEGLRDGPVLNTFAAVLEEERVQVVEESIDARLHAGRCAEVVPELRRHLDAHPLREHAYAQLMTALYRSGDVSGALATFGTAREQLTGHLGVDPGRPLVDLHRAILERDPLLDGPRDQPEPRRVSAADPVRAPGAPFLTPPRVADFTGRDTEIGYGVRVLTDGPREALPIVAISGLPGVGKTALAVAIAHRVRAHYPDGQLYADLHGDRPRPASPAGIAAQFLSSMGLPGDRIPGDQAGCVGMLRSVLDGRRILVVLDNAADEAQVRALLPGTAGCGVLVTGRAPLPALDGARLLPLACLAEADAAGLFTDILGRPVGFERAAVRQIVRSCGRLPLAVRIAAVRAASRPGWPLTRFVALLSEESTRLDALRAGDLDVRSRLAGGYRALPPADRRLLRQLSLLNVPVFTAAAVTGEDPAVVADRLEALVDAGFLTEVAPGCGYRMHILVRLLVQDQIRGSCRTATPSTRTAGK